jgi:hypothetical protein
MQYLAGVATKQTVRVPEGTIGLSIVTTTGFTSLTLTGHTSGAVYGSVGSVPAGNFYTFPFSTSPDDQADFAIVTAIGQAGTLYARADFSPPESAQGANFTTRAIPIVIPNLATWPIVTANGALNTYGAWSQITASGQLPSDPAGLAHVVMANASAANLAQIQVGIGAPGAEIAIGSWPAAQGALSTVTILPIFPLILLLGNPRVACRYASSNLGGAAIQVAIGIYSLPL